MHSMSIPLCDSQRFYQNLFGNSSQPKEESRRYKILQIQSNMRAIFYSNHTATIERHLVLLSMSSANTDVKRHQVYTLSGIRIFQHWEIYLSFIDLDKCFDLSELRWKVQSGANHLSLNLHHEHEIRFKIMKHGTMNNRAMIQTSFHFNQLNNLLKRTWSKYGLLILSNKIFFFSENDPELKFRRDRNQIALETNLYCFLPIVVYIC
ncbi:hypothetical protein BpHYR1_028771 [Brachionus plicatilis]|uniref:Uncharacterized protein n=1 Tax=Brachionus plicatilis TaxID=10195 RepID=A0A3M7RS86_BRAPC|nr:hypothetical protein BpHYR1_028771 [Brachionus plicatilis]